MKFKKRLQKGFSLVEVLLAIGTLAVGMLFVAGTFVVGIHFTTVSTERTTAAVVSDEAFSKMRLFGVGGGVDSDLLRPYYEVSANVMDPDEYAYPSTETGGEKQYFWSGLCRRLDDPNFASAGQLVQATVFVCRKVGAASEYPAGDGAGGVLDRPVPVPVGVDWPVGGPGGRDIIVVTVAGEERWFNGGVKVVDGRTGWIYRVLSRDGVTGDILLDRRWQGTVDPDLVWLVPSPVAGGRNPCIAVYQRLIRSPNLRIGGGGIGPIAPRP